MMKPVVEEFINACMTSINSEKTMKQILNIQIMSNKTAESELRERTTAIIDKLFKQDSIKDVLKKQLKKANEFFKENATEKIGDWDAISNYASDMALGKIGEVLDNTDNEYG